MSMTAVCVQTGTITSEMCVPSELQCASVGYVTFPPSTRTKSSSQQQRAVTGIIPLLAASLMALFYLNATTLDSMS